MSPVWRWLKGFATFWYDFVVGDDWTIAAGIAVALGATYGLAQAKPVPAWWLLPLACIAIVAVAVRRANLREQPEAPADGPDAEPAVAERKSVRGSA